MIHASIVVPIALVACPASAAAFCQMTTEGGEECSDEGIPLAWETRCISFSVDARNDQNLSEEVVRGATQRAFQTWTSQHCNASDKPHFYAQLTREPAFCKEAEFCRDRGNANVISFSETWPPRRLGERVDLNPNAQASTLLSFNTRTGEIVDADILLNAQTWSFQQCLRENCLGEDRTRLDLENVLAHEVGHLLGLAHPGDEPVTATMFRSQNPGETQKRTLHPDDIAGFCAIYGARALTLPCDPTPVGGFEPDCESGEPCRVAGSSGCAVNSATADARPSENLYWLATILGLVRLRRRRRLRLAGDRARPREDMQVGVAPPG